MEVPTTRETVVDLTGVMATMTEEDTAGEVVALVEEEIALMEPIEEAMTEVGVVAAVPRDKNQKKIIVATTTTMAEEHQEVGVVVKVGTKRTSMLGLVTTSLRVKK